MDVKKTMELYKSTASFLDALNSQLIDRAYEAINSAEKELGKTFHGLRDWIRAPFGHRPTGVQVINELMTQANSDPEVCTFYEHVFMGSSHKHTYRTTDIKTIVKYL